MPGEILTSPPPGTVPIMVGTELRYVPKDEAKDLNGTGARKADEEDIADAVSEAESNTPLQKVAGSAYSFAKGATQGFLGKGLISGAEAFGTPADADAMRYALKSLDKHVHHPLIEMAGGVAPLLIPGVGELAGAETVAGRIGVQAAMGALPAAGRVVTEAAIENKPVAIESLLTETGLGGALGAIGGAAFEGGGALIGKLRGGGLGSKLEAESAKSVAEHLGGEAMPEGIPGQQNVEPGAWSKLSSAVSGVEPEVIQEHVGFNPTASKNRRLAFEDAPKVHDNAIREITQAGNELDESLGVLRDLHSGDKKFGNIAEHIKTGNEYDSVPFALSKLQQVIDGNAELLQTTEGKLAPKLAEGVSKKAYEAIEQIKSAPLDEMNATAFKRLDEMKRSIQKISKKFARAGRSENPDISDMQGLSTEWYAKTAEDLRGALEDRSVWGKAAENQANINAPYSKFIDTGERYNHAFMTKVGRQSGMTGVYRDKWGMDPARVGTYVRNVIDPEKDLVHTAVSEHLSSAEKLVDSISNAYSLSESEVAEVARAKQAITKFKSAIEDASEASAAVNRAARLRGKDSTAMGAAAAFAMSGHPVGAAGARLFGALSNPEKTARIIYAIEKMTSKSNNRIAQSVHSLLSGESAPAARASFVQPSKEETIAKAKSVMGLVSDPNSMMNHINRTVGNLAPHAPSIAAAMAGKLANSYQYLASIAPRPIVRPSMTPQFDKPKYSEDQVAIFARALRINKDPLIVVDEIKKGQLRRSDVDALKNLRPAIFDKIREQIIEKSAELKKQVPYGKEVQISLLFDAPINPTMEPAFMQSMQATTITDTAPPATGPKSPQKQGGGRRPIQLNAEETYGNGPIAKGE